MGRCTNFMKRGGRPGSLVTLVAAGKATLSQVGRLVDAIKGASSFSDIREICGNTPRSLRRNQTPKFVE